MMTSLVAEDSGEPIGEVVGVLQLKTTSTKKRIIEYIILIIAKLVVIIAAFWIYFRSVIRFDSV